MYTNKRKILLTVAVTAFIGVSSWIVFRSSEQDEDFVKIMEREHKGTFSEIKQYIQKDNELITKLEESISNNDTATALSLIDTLVTSERYHLAAIYKGMLFEKQNKFAQALVEYNNAIIYDPYSKARSRRASLYLKQNKFDSAIVDYKAINVYNNYYSLIIGDIYFNLRNKDSALKYYLNYSRQYPNDQPVLHKIQSIQNN